MAIPSLPTFFDMKFVEENGNLTKDGLMYNDQLAQALFIAVNLVNSAITSSQDTTAGASPNTYVNQGIVAPSFTSAQITALLPNALVGTIWFNTDISKLQVCTAANTVETITST